MDCPDIVLEKLISRLQDSPHDGKSLDDRMEEFGEWVTTRIDSIEDHDEYLTRVEGFRRAVDFLGELRLSECGMSEASVRIARNIFDPGESTQRKVDGGALSDFIDFIYAITGTTDNNIKCQLSPYLRHTMGWDSLPLIRSSKSSRLSVQNKKTFDLGQFKRDDLVRCVEKIITNSSPDQEVLDAGKKLVQAFLSCIFDCGNYRRLQEVVEVLQRQDHSSTQCILETFAVFQLRGSAAALSGHGPEEKLRVLLTEWGMESNIDFNLVDVIPDVIAGNEIDKGKKTRAYDFILPFNAKTCPPRIFIQSQIYAGDSGSVSHKNVDQIPLSRRRVLELFPNAIFLEFLDGAGYCTALSGDLRKILAMNDTHGFFQANTAILNLRRALISARHLFAGELVAWSIKTELYGKERYSFVEKRLREFYGNESVEHVLGLLNASSLRDIWEGRRELGEQKFIAAVSLAIMDILDEHSEVQSMTYARIPGKIGRGVNIQQYTKIKNSVTSVLGVKTFDDAIDYLVGNAGALRLTNQPVSP